MTQQKAASLTSSLFARKGKASPASLLISELQDGDPETDGPTTRTTVIDGLGANGTGIKIPVSELNGAAGRRKAKAPEPELPLLAFVEAQVAEDAEAPPRASEEDSAGAAETAGKQGAVEADGPAKAAEAASTAPPAEEPRPAASLLDRGPQALAGVNGLAATSTSEATRLADSESEFRSAAAAPESDAGEAIEAVTVSGDGNVAAIEDAPQDDPSLDDIPQDGASPKETPEPEAAEALADDGPVGPDAVILEAENEKTSGAVESVVVPPLAEAETAAAEAAPSEKPDAALLKPLSERNTDADAAISATVALRKAATLPPPRSLPKTAVAPPAAAPRALPWRSAAVVVLGAALGLGAYVAFSGKQPAQLPAEAPVTAPAPEVAADPATAAAPQAASGQVEVAPAETAAKAVAPAAPLPEPSFDVIRIEPDGQSIIAGRAEPSSEWILLNNGRPIASVRADANGEWVVLPDASLVPGANAFSLVPKTERGKVAIPAPTGAPSAPGQAEPASEAEAPLAPRSDAGGDAGADTGALQSALGIALPKPKPNPGAAVLRPLPVLAFRIAPDGAYEVQIASVRQSADAERERARLAAAFPALLGALDLRVQEASVEGAGTFFRVRSGAIEDLGVAREVCRLLEAEGQGCLVVRRAAAPELPQTEVVQDEVQAHSSARQQAERPR